MALVLEDITHDYGTGPVLHGVRLSVAPGAVHALLGMNGAGKSTLVHVATGVVRPTAGRVVVDGREARLDDPGRAQAAGIVLLAQEVDRALVGPLPVHENLRPGAPGLRAFSPRRSRAEARALLDRHGVALDVDRPASSLSLYEKQVVCLVRAAAGDARYLLLDEPTASFDVRETQRFYRLVEALRADGIGLVFISHRLDEVFAVSDEVTVLRHGHEVLHAPAAATTREEVVAAMTGDLQVARRRSARVPAAEPVSGGGHGARGRHDDATPPALRATLALGRGRRDVDLAVRQGQVLAVFGLLGAGKTRLAEQLFAVHGGYRAFLDGRERRLASPAAAARAGLALVPEERRRQGLWLREDVRTHLSLGFRGLVRPRRELAHAHELVQRFDIEPPEPGRQVRRLSGGNQQKVSIAKWFAAPRRLVVLDEPMKGVDVAAKEAIFASIERAADEGAGVVYLTAEPDDALRIADRVLVLGRAGPVWERPAAGLEPIDLMRAADLAEAAAVAPDRAADQPTGETAP